MKRMMPISGRWLVVTEEDLLGMPEEDAEGILALYNEYEKNKLSFFLGHGGAIDFINDRENDLCVLTAPNRAGKSYAGAQWLAMRILPCDPDWPCFKNHGLKFHEWEGPTESVVCSYTIKDHLRAVIAPLILNVFPDDELKEYSPRYKGKGKKKINWMGEMQLPLGCGSIINHRAYMQDQSSFESAAFQYVWKDEQAPRAKVDGLVERGRTGLNRTQYCATLTPHAMPSWPETGAAGPIMKALKGQIDLGLSIGHYTISIEDVPTCIYPQIEKEKAYRRWVLDPQKTGNQKDIREGQARYYGLPQSSQGLVVDDFDTDIHWIDPIEIKRDWTLYRGIDHGTNNPTACTWLAVNPEGFIFVYREYKEAGRAIPENAEAIVELSGNKRIHIDNTEMAGGMTRPIYDEDFCSENYAGSVLDSRSFGTKSDGINKNGNLYNEWGLYCTPASGKRDSYFIPLMRSFFMVNPKLKNPITGEMGSPRIFIFNTCTGLRNELESIVFKDNSVNQNSSEDARKKDDHLFDSLKYNLGQDPTYLGDKYMQPYEVLNDKHRPKPNVNSYTGY